MATALIAGLSAIGSFAAANAGALIMAGITAAATLALKPDAPDMPGTQATPMDKTQLQKEAELGKLQLGEEAEDKRKRRKGKAAFKIEKDEAVSQEVTPVTAPKSETAGIQI